MTFDQLINGVATALKPRVAQAGGEVVVARSLEAARGQLLASAPNRWKLILHWEGFGEHEHSREGMTTHQVATVIHQKDGLLHRPGDHLTKPGPSGEMPFSARIQQVCAWMCSMRFPNGTGADDAGFAMAGSQWVDAAPNSTAHALNWRLDAALPAFETTIPLEFPHLTPDTP